MKKKAMAVPIREEDRRNMAAEGVFVLENMYKRLPDTTQAQLKSFMEEMKSNGTTKFFETLDPKTAIQLPAIFVADPNNLVEIDGAGYYVVDVTEPKEVKKKSNINGVEYQKGDKYPGEIICMDIESGNPVSFPYDDAVNKIKVPQENREKILQEMNNEIAAWNQRVETIEKAAGVTKLSLQVQWVEGKLQERIETLKAQKQGMQNKIENPLTSRPAYGSWTQFLRDEVASGKSNLKDAFDALLFLYQSSPQKLIDGIQNGQIEVPDELRNGILGVAAQEARLREDKAKEQAEKAKNRTQRMEDALDPTREVEEVPLTPLTMQNIPEQQYNKLNKNKTLFHWQSSFERTIQGIEKDRIELTDILNSFSSLRQYIGALEKGQRAKEYLASSDGTPIMGQLNAFLEVSQKFIKRYETNIVENGVLNTKLMGRGGTIGNALIAVALHRIYNIVQKTLGDILAGGTEAEKEPVEQQTPLEPVTKSLNKIQKMSETLWQAFVKRMRLR